MPEKIKSSIPRILFKACVFMAFTITSAFLILAGFDTTRELYFGYKEQGDISYTVNLKDDNFMGVSTLPAGETYYTDLIEEINAELQYNADFTGNVTGDYTYLIVANVSAKKDNGEELWSRTYTLNTPSIHRLRDNQKLRLSVMQPIDYRKFNQMLQDFSSEYGLPASGELRIGMMVNGEFWPDIMDKSIKVDTVVGFSVPLARDSVKVSIETNTNKDGKVYSKTISIDDDAHLFSRVTGLFLACATLFLVACQIAALIRERNAHRYEYTVAKLRDDYDDIIVDIKTAPKMTGFNVSTVQAFDELLDVYNSIKMPINYYETKDSARFIIINGKLAWQYIINKEDFIEKPAPRRRRTRRRK